MTDSGSEGWRWIEEQPGVIVVVVLILAFSLLFPQDACRGRTSVERPQAEQTVDSAGQAD